MLRMKRRAAQVFLSDGPLLSGIVVIALPEVEPGYWSHRHQRPPLGKGMLVTGGGVQRPVILVSHQDEPYLLLVCSVKKRTICVEASGPLLHDGLTAGVVVDAAGVGMPACYLPPFHFHV